MTRLRPTVWLAAAMLLVALPLLWPAVPPLVDLPGHIGRYHIAAELAHSPELQRHWTYAWALIGNLGVDLPAIALTPWLGAERAAKLVVLTIPALTQLGLFALAHVRRLAVPPLAGFACALAYGQAFQMGFVNFALAQGLALLALAGWIALAGRPVLRCIVFIPVAMLLWIAHSSGWGLFGVAAWAAEIVLARERGRGWASAMSGATIACLPLALPVLAMGGGAGGVEWTVKAKAAALVSLVRDRWQVFDIASAIVLVGLAWTAIRQRDWRIDPVLGASAAAVFASFLILPRLAMGGAYVDMRMLAPALAILLMAVRIERPRTAARLFVGGAVFLLVRMLATTVSFLLYAQAGADAAAAIPYMPRGSAVLVLVNEPCASTWHSDRVGHIGGIAIARRDIFENGQWAIPGQQLLGLKPPIDPRYHADPSQLVYPGHCEYRPTELRAALSGFDRARYTHVWLVGFGRVGVPGDLSLRYRDEASALYRVSSRSPLVAPPFPPVWAGDAGG